MKHKWQMLPEHLYHRSTEELLKALASKYPEVVEELGNLL